MRPTRGDKTAPEESRAQLTKARRLVVKLGSGVVCNAENEFDRLHVGPLAASIAALVREGRQVVLVSSGAITLGAGELHVHRSRLNDPSVNRACAAVGQCKLMEAYAEVFRPHGLIAAQVLVTEDDFTDLKRYRILRETFEKLLKLGAVPVVNENDAVTNIYTEQAPVFRDNDRLAALVLSKLDAQALVLLSNVDGLLRIVDGSPQAGSVVPLVARMTPEIRQSASGKSATGRGGMTAKLDAAEIAMQAGGLAVIANGKTPRVLERILAGENIGTLFLPGTRLAGKRRWLAFASSVRGQVAINANARKALLNGRASLLLSGVTACKGAFSSGEVIAVLDSEGATMGRGIAECGSQEIQGALSAALPAKGVLVRRENFLIFEKEAHA